MTPSLKISTQNTMMEYRYIDTMIADLSPTSTHSQSRIAQSNNDESLNMDPNNQQNYSKIALEDGNYQYLYHGVSTNIHTVYCYHYTPSQGNCTMTDNGSSYSCSHLMKQQNDSNDPNYNNYRNYDYYMHQYHCQHSMQRANSPSFSYSTTGNYHRNRDINTKTSSDSRIAGVEHENTLIKTGNNLIISKIASDSIGSPQSDISALDLNVSMMSPLNLDHY